MLTEIYIEALLVDEELADQVWEAWDAGEISDFVAAWAWWIVADDCCIKISSVSSQLISKKKEYKGRVVALVRCRECKYEISDRAKTCPNCGEPNTSILTKFTRYYFIGGFVFFPLYAVIINPIEAGWMAASWLFVGPSLALIAYGMPRKSASRLAGLLYGLGIAWLILALVVGIELIWIRGFGLHDLQRILD